MKVFFSINFILFFSIGYGQNLVVNSNFEDTSAAMPCDNIPGSGYYQVANFWYNAANFTGFGSSVDYSCPGNTLMNPLPLNPPSGTGAVGMAGPGIAFPQFTEAVTANLTQSIPPGATITISLAVSPRQGLFNGVNEPNIPFGVYFYDCGNVAEDSIGTGNHHLSSTPQVVIPTTGFTLNTWSTYSTTYVASGCYSKVAIGFFNPNNLDGSTPRYFAIDDVSITSTSTTLTCGGSPTGSGGDATLCAGSSYSFPSRTCGTGTLRWYENNLGTGTFYTGATVNPSSTTTYYPFCFTGSCLNGPGNPATATVSCSPTVLSGSIWTWTGCASTDWFNPCNWDRGSIPNSTSNVIIPNTINKPSINGSVGDCFDIQINSSTGARLDILSSSGGGLTIHK